MPRLFLLLTNAFPVWVFLAAFLALINPSLFTWFQPYITPGLGVIMLGMGLTLTLEDFREVARRPILVLTGFILQYTIMPFAGWLSARTFHLPAPLAAGLILVACCAGGTASNVVAYLAKADVPLSVTMTAVSTLLAVVMTPALTTWLIGDRVEVNAYGLFMSTLQVVILPVAAGVLLNRYFQKAARALLPVAPLTAVIFITLIVASIVGSGRSLILQSGASLLLAVLTLHGLGFALGYAAGRILTRLEIPARTISIEVGMQNSGLGVVLARRNFADPAVAIPCAISSVFHSLIGSLLAALWRAISREKKAKI